MINEAWMIRILKGCLSSRDVWVHSLTHRIFFQKKKKKTVKVEKDDLQNNVNNLNFNQIIFINVRVNMIKRNLITFAIEVQ